MQAYVCTYTGMQADMVYLQRIGRSLTFTLAPSCTGACAWLQQLSAQLGKLCLQHNKAVMELLYNGTGILQTLQGAHQVFV